MADGPGGVEPREDNEDHEDNGDSEDDGLRGTLSAPDILKPGT